MGKNRNFYQNNEEVTNEAEAPVVEDAAVETAPVETPVVEDKKPEPTPEPEPVVTNTTNKKPEIKSVQKKGTATL